MFHCKSEKLNTTFANLRKLQTQYQNVIRFGNSPDLKKKIMICFFPAHSHKFLKCMYIILVLDIKGKNEPETELLTNIGPKNIN